MTASHKCTRAELEQTFGEYAEDVIEFVRRRAAFRDAQAKKGSPTCNDCEREHSQDVFCPRRVARALILADPTPFEHLSSADETKLKELADEIDLIEVLEEYLIH